MSRADGRLAGPEAGGVDVQRDEALHGAAGDHEHDLQYVRTFHSGDYQHLSDADQGQVEYAITRQQWLTRAASA